MMQRFASGNRALNARVVLTNHIPQDSSYPGLVMGKKVSNPVRKSLGNNTRVVRKVTSRVALCPATHVMERQRQIIVEQAGIGLDVFGEQLVYETVVEVQSLLIQDASSIR